MSSVGIDLAAAAVAETASDEPNAVASPGRPPYPTPTVTPSVRAENIADELAGC